MKDGAPAAGGTRQALARLDRPFLFLTAWFALANVQLLVNAVRPPLPTTDQAQLVVLAIMAALLGLATVLTGARRPGEDSLLVLLLLAELLLTAVVIVAAGGQGQFMAALYLLVLTLIAALSMSSRRVWVVLVVGLVLYVAGLAVNRLLDTPAYAAFIVVTVTVVARVVTALVGSLRDQAQHDQLTGALNRHGLEASARLARDLAAREGRDTAVVVVDLDSFKQFNDTFGHAAGDRRLAQLAEDWSRVLRRTDLVARVGGDEFVVVLPGAGTDEAEELVSRMRNADDIPWAAGVTTWPTHESFDQALTRADASMYADKRSRPHGSGA